MFPVGGGGNDGGFTLPDGNGGGGGDAATDGASDGAAPALIDASIFVGRVCLANDPRKLNTCATTGAGGLTVRLGNATTTTAADGTFTIPGQTDPVWHVSGDAIVSSHMIVGDYEIPAITKATYAQMITDNLQGLKLNPGEGSLMVQLIKNGQGAPSAFGQTSPLSAWEAFYDSASSPTTWQQASSGVDGTAWFAGLDVGTVSVTMTLGDDVTKTGLPIVDGGITFTTVIFP